jgi:hypothetical protein
MTRKKNPDAPETPNARLHRTVQTLRDNIRIVGQECGKELSEEMLDTFVWQVFHANVMDDYIERQFRKFFRLEPPPYRPPDNPEEDG